MSPPEESSAAGGAAPAPAEALPTTLPPGTIIAERYRIDSLIGEGGMGKVYAAEHVHIQKQVAIKVLHEEMSSTPEYVARFEREAIAAAKISHPNVAAATDFGMLPNRSFYIVLEYVAGTDLRTLLGAGALPKARAIRIVRQVASAVGAAHAVGIVHRDLKPENVMVVDRDGDPDCVKVLDFGIAKFDVMSPSQSSASSRGGEAPLTKIGAIFGTPDYMSPEQALGQTIDIRSDLYSLGVIFHELLTGERLFKGGAVTLMRSHVLEEAPALPPRVAHDVGPRLVAVIQKLLQKSPSDRFASSAELIAALDAATADEARGEPVKTVAFPLIPARARAPEEPPAREAIALAPSIDSFPEFRPKKRGSLGLTLLLLAAAAGACVYFFGPPGILGSLLNGVLPTSPAESAADSSSAEVPAEPARRTESAPAASPAPTPADSSGPAPDDPASPAEEAPDASALSSVDAASAAPHPSAARPPAPKPSAKPVHKPPKGVPPKHTG
jgi:serine/threonine protein kinase